MNIKELVAQAYSNAVNKGFWSIGYDETSGGVKHTELATRSGFNLLVGTKIALIHSELSEALAGWRNGDTKNYAEELADVAIRLADLAGGTGVDLEAEIAAKMMKNKNRSYLHGGKRF